MPDDATSFVAVGGPGLTFGRPCLVDSGAARTGSSSLSHHRLRSAVAAAGRGGAPRPGDACARRLHGAATGSVVERRRDRNIFQRTCGTDVRRSQFLGARNPSIVPRFVTGLRPPAGGTAPRRRDRISTLPILITAQHRQERAIPMNANRPAADSHSTPAPRAQR